VLKQKELSYIHYQQQNVDWVKALGADRVIDYKTEDYKEVANNLDIVLTL
jgi:NADPH:quinone reductase-like Zn-dependent oxidoreductase